MKFFGSFAGYKPALCENVRLFSKTHSSSRMTSCNSPQIASLNGNQVYKFSLSADASVMLKACSGRYANWFGFKTTTLTILANCHNTEHKWAASNCPDSLLLSVTTTKNLPVGFHDVLYFRISSWFSIVSFKLPPFPFHTNRM